jgi:type IV secretory pathway VirB10-like protein
LPAICSHGHQAKVTEAQTTKKQKNKKQKKKKKKKKKQKKKKKKKKKKDNTLSRILAHSSIDDTSPLLLGNGGGVPFALLAFIATVTRRSARFRCAR